MKAQIIAHTPVGVFKSKIDEYSAQQYEELKEFVSKIAQEGTYMSFSTDGGYITIAKEALCNSVIVLTVR